MKSVDEIAIELDKISCNDKYWDNSIFMIPDYIEDATRAVRRMIVEECLHELEVAKGKVVLAAYHSGVKADVDWITHRINVLKEELQEGEVKP